MKILKLIMGIGQGIILWMGIAFSVIGYQHSPYQYLGFGLIVTYSILNKIQEIEE